MKMISFSRGPQSGIPQFFKNTKINKRLFGLLCVLSMSFMFSYTANAQGPTSTCDDPIEVSSTICGNDTSPNTPSGQWGQLPNDGIITILFGFPGGAFIPIDLNCLDDDMDAVGDMEIRLASSAFVPGPNPSCGIYLENVYDIRDSDGNESLNLVTVLVKFTGCNADVVPPVVTCAEFSNTFDACPSGFGPNTPNGDWIPMPASGMINNAVGGIFTYVMDVSTCITDDVSALGEMEYTLVDSYSENSVPGCSIDLINEFGVRDACGNVSVANIIFRGTIQFTGTTPPVITCPANVMVNTGTSINPAVTGMATATTDCGNATVTFADNTTAACGIDGVITRTWTATNGCGQSSTCDQIITLNDVTPPNVTCAEFTGTFNRCPDPIGPNTPSGDWIPVPASGMFLTAAGGSSIITVDLNGCVTDECSDFGDMEWMLVSSFEENRVPGCSVDILNEIRIRDGSGNESTNTIFTRSTMQFDGPAPIITCPANVMLECGASTDPANTGMATATSGCGTPAITFVDNMVSTCGMAGTITRTWTATDGCGQTSTCNQTITLTDTTVPEVTCAEFQTTFSGCPDPIGPNTPSGNWLSLPPNGMISTAVGGIYVATLDLSTCLSDNCSDLAGLDYMISDSYSENRVPGCSVDIINEFMIRDACGNVSPVKFNFRGTIQFDGPAPVITCPANVVVECGNPTDPANTGMATATSGCGSPAITSGDVFVAACGNTGTITRTWTATDGCGRTSTCQQTITIVDTTPPTVTLPANVTLDCGEDTSPANTGTATALDVCDGALSVSHVDDNQVKTCTGGTILRTWTSTDVCGNTASEIQTIIVLPPPGPTIVCPADFVVSCEDEINLDPNDAIVTTSCDLGYTVYIKQPLAVGAPGCNGTVYTYIYKVVDDCGRVAKCEQQVLIQNTPASISAPAGGIVDCFADIDLSVGDATVNNSCAAYNLYLDAPTINGPIGCPGTTYTYTYRLLDVCGNNIEEDVVFTNANTPPPTIQAPDDLVTMCLGGTNPNPDEAIVTAACDAGYDVTVTGPQIIGSMDCPNTRYRYTYTVTDECGRTASDIQDYFVQNGPPEFYGCEEDNWLQFNCEDYGGEGGTIAAIEAYIASVKASSSCGVNLNVVNNFNSNNINTCYNGVPQSITFFATDNCGRTSTCTTYYVVTDTEAPDIYLDAEDHWEICNYNSPANFQAWVDDNGGAEAYDGCSNDNVSWFTIPANPTFSCMGAAGITSVTVTFGVVDNCGNTSTTTATFNAFMGGGNDIIGEDTDVTLENAQETKDGVVLFPNPADTRVYVDLKEYESRSAVIRIYNALGRLEATKVVEEIGTTPYQFNLSGYSSGAYVMSVDIDGTKRIAKRFIVTGLNDYKR